MKSNAPKWLYALPNSFTLASLFAGFYAITLLLSGEITKTTYIHACIALIIATFCDMMDGRVARMTHTQSDFGMQLDSLADAVAFGLAPAVLVYKWGLSGFGVWGTIAAFAFAACGVCRLARFNVMEMRKTISGPSRYFTGLPIPFAAGMLVSVILYAETAYISADQSVRFGVLALTFILSYLMISTIPFRTFKDLQMKSPQTLLMLGLTFSLIAFGTFLYGFTFAFLFLFAAYVAGGLMSELLGYFRRLVGLVLYTK